LAWVTDHITRLYIYETVTPVSTSRASSITIIEIANESYHYTFAFHAKKSVKLQV